MNLDYVYGFSRGLHGIPQEPGSHDKTRGWLHGQECAARLLKEGIPVSNVFDKTDFLPIFSALSQFAEEMRAMREQVSRLLNALEEIEDEPEGMSLDGRQLPGERDQRESL